MNKPGRPLRIAALAIALTVVLVIIVLPAHPVCPDRGPDEYDPLPCEVSAFTPPRVVVGIVALVLIIALLLVAAIRDSDQR